ncbi:MAG: Uma2 family endonuclease [Thermoanaerobaculia bacterium]
MAVPIQKRFVTIDEYHRMAEEGVFPPDARLELIRGEIVEMSPIGPRHSGSVRRFNRNFSARLSPYAIVDVQNPVEMRDQESEPQPDITLLRLQDDLYSNATPTPGDTLLVVEVADSSLSFDRRVKMHLYAEAGIPESWLVDLNSGTLHVYRRPSPEGYKDVRSYRRGESVAPEAFPDVVFTLDEILG